MARREPVAGGVDLGSAISRQDLTYPRVVVLQELVPSRVTYLRRPLGRPGDIGHEHRGQHSLTHLRFAEPPPATPQNRDGGLVTYNPLVVSRWDVEYGSGRNEHLAPIVHANHAVARNTDTDVVELATLRTGDRLDLLRPPPTRLLDETSHSELAEGHIVGAALRKCQHLVRIREVL